MLLFFLPLLLLARTLNQVLSHLLNEPVRFREVKWLVQVLMRVSDIQARFLDS